TVIHNYLKANNVKYASHIVSKLASKLWKNESTEIKNVYKKLAETTTKRYNNEKPTFLKIPPINAEPICVQFPNSLSFNINSPTIINNTATISVQTLLDIQYDLIIISLH
ncbi:19845_t:CDS:1, partial [Gigaspora rosea]